MNSINTNPSALAALQAMNASDAELMATQQRVTTGLKVSSPKDNGAIFAIATRQRADASSITTVNESLNRAKSAIDVALTAGQQISDILIQMKELALTGTEDSIDSSSRRANLEQYEAYRSQIVEVMNHANFDGINLLTSPNSTDFLDSTDGSSKLSIPGQDWNYSPWTPGPVIMLRGYSLDTTTYASYALDEVSQTIPNVSRSLAQLGSIASQIDRKITFNAKLQDSMNAGIGNLVDADLSKDSAKLASDQIKQQLSQKALSISVSEPQFLLSLFNNKG